MLNVYHLSLHYVFLSWQVLCGTGFLWVSSGSGHVPDGAVVAGNQISGEPLYIGRASFNGSVTPGKIHQSHACLYIPFGGVEHSISEYEVLVERKCKKYIFLLILK